MAIGSTIALRFDVTTGRCGVVIEGGRLVLDRTPATRMMIALGTDARARADDALPDEPAAAPSPVLILNPRRGWAGDALDPAGRRLGSRLWLLSRALQTEDTRTRAVLYAEDALRGLSTDLAQPIAVAADWIRRNTLGLVARVGATRIDVALRVAQ